MTKCQFDGKMCASHRICRKKNIVKGSGACRRIREKQILKEGKICPECGSPLDKIPLSPVAYMLKCSSCEYKKIKKLEMEFQINELPDNVRLGNF